MMIIIIITNNNRQNYKYNKDEKYRKNKFNENWFI